jgi:hypothetical protein
MYAAEYAKTHPDKPAIVMAASGEVVTFGEYEACGDLAEARILSRVKVTSSRHSADRFRR